MHLGRGFERRERKEIRVNKRRGDKSKEMDDSQEKRKRNGERRDNR